MLQVGDVINGYCVDSRLLCGFQALHCFRNLRSVTESVISDYVTFQRDFIHSVEAGIWAITDLNYGWVALFSNKSYVSIDIPQDILFASINNREPGFQTTIDFILWLASFIFKTNLCWLVTEKYSANSWPNQF